MMRRNLSCRFGLASGLVLAAAWAAFTVPEQADAARPPRETIVFDVRVTGDMKLVGTLDPQTCEILGDPMAEGRSDRRSVIVNRPSPAIRMDFLAALPCFTAGDIYGLDCGGTLVIRQARNDSASIEYFFRAAREDALGVADLLVGLDRPVGVEKQHPDRPT